MVFGGPYSNLEATRAVLGEAARLEIAADRIICTGDVVAYGADPAATVELVRGSVRHVVMGNCEQSIAAGSADCGCGFPTGSTCERLSAAWFAHATRELNADARAWMADLPRRIDIEMGSYRLAVIHGGVDIMNRFIFASTVTAIKFEEMRKIALDGVIAGHCGLPFTQAINGQLWHNAGAVGMPANDGTPRVWFSLLRAEAEGITIEHRALDYDFATAAAKMRRRPATRVCGFPRNRPLAQLRRVAFERDSRTRRSLGTRQCLLVAFAAIRWCISPQAVARLHPTLAAHRSRHGAEASAAEVKNPHFTATGQPRASVTLRRLKRLWFNTGTLCIAWTRVCQPAQCRVNRVNLIFDQLWFAARRPVAPAMLIHDRKDPRARGRYWTGSVGSSAPVLRYPCPVRSSPNRWGNRPASLWIAEN